MDLGERKLKILKAVVETYVATGEPVGSKALCEALDFPVSSATIRNEMAELAEMGLLEQPHTSAGRIPSQRGYRYYVDALLPKYTLSVEERSVIDSVLFDSAYDPEKLMNSVSRALAAMTRFTAVSTTPSGSAADIRAVQFVQTSRRTAMVVLMTSAGTMKTRVFHCDFDITSDILRVYFRTLNEKLVGRPVVEVTPAFIQGLAASLGEMAILMSAPLSAVLEVARESMGADLCMHGETNLLFCPEFELGGARQIMDFLSRPEELTNLILQPGGAKVLIGREIQRKELADTSMVFAPYYIGGQEAGSIAVIGPTRMHYSRVIAGIDYLAEAVGKMLTELMSNE